MKTIYHIYLLKLLKENEPTTIFNIASKMGYSQGVIALAIKELKKTGLIETRSGTFGGILLTKPYKSILVKDIIPVIAPQERVLLAFAKYVPDDRLCDIIKNMD